MSYTGHLGYVPVQLIQHCQKNHLENTLRVYLALKYGNSDGIVTYNKQMLEYYSCELGVSERTIKNQIKRLQELKWISIDEHKTLFIRSYKWLERDAEWGFRTRVELTRKDLEKDRFKPYLMGAVIGYFVKLQRDNMYSTGRREARPVQLKYTPFPLSYSYLNTLTNKCNDQLNSNIKWAIKLGYIKKVLKITPVKLLTTKSEVLALRKDDVEMKGYLFWKEGKAYLRHSDHFLGLLHYKKFRKRRNQIAA